MNRTLLIFFMLLCCVLGKAQVAAQGRTGILLVHYGTQNDKSRAATIDLLNSRVASEFPDCRVREAYVAQAVVKALGKRGIAKLSVAQAIDSLKAEGCSRIVVQTTMLLDGVMTDIMRRDVESRSEGLEAVTVGRPLLYTVDDCRSLVDMIARNIKADSSLPQKDVQVVLVGHGSDSPANAIYSQIDYLAKDEGRALWHVGTIEGYPNMGCVERRLKLSKAKNVILVPLLYIAGNHQKEDIDGAWRKQLTADGYNVSVVGRGLGEMREVQDMIIESIRKNMGK